MKVIGVILIWILAASAVIGAAFFVSRDRAKTAIYSRLPRAVRVFVGVVVLALAVVLPVSVALSAKDRLPGGAGNYTIDTTANQREGRTIFRSTCASCHALSAVGARGVTGPNLDELKPNYLRVRGAIKLGGTGQNLMPAGLLQGPDADLVAKYIVEVAGK